MAERNLGIKVDEETYRKVKVRIAQKGLTLKEYIIDLIEKDIKEEHKK